MVDRKEDLKQSLASTFKLDNQVLIEPCITDGVEVTCTVHDITLDELLEAFVVSEVKQSKDQYCSEHAEVFTPSRNLHAEVVQQVIKIAKVAYRALNLCGIASFDFIVKVKITL